jgi:hypothetical protein
MSFDFPAVLGHFGDEGGTIQLVFAAILLPKG